MSGSAKVTDGSSSGMMSTARVKLPYPQVSQAKFLDETSRRGKERNICETLTCQ